MRAAGIATPGTRCSSPGPAGPRCRRWRSRPRARAGGATTRRHLRRAAGQVDPRTCRSARTSRRGARRSRDQRCAPDAGRSAAAWARGGCGDAGRAAGVDTVQAALWWTPLRTPPVLCRARRSATWSAHATQLGSRFHLCLRLRRRPPGALGVRVRQLHRDPLAAGCRARGGPLGNFPQGQWTASYRFGLARGLEAGAAGGGWRQPCATRMRTWCRASRARRRAWQRQGSLGLGRSRPEGWFAHATALAWPDRSRQQPWDPDYLYGLGWTQPGPAGLTVQYANYSGNRWPGRARSTGEGLFRSGSVSVSWGAAW